MVCKEDVYSWFQNLKASKRIEAISGILNMCYPIELRFYGTCIEDLGRKDFYVFKEDELKANDITEIIKIRNIHESCTRSRLIILLSLLNSSNFLCAKEIFKVLSEEIKIENLAMSGYLLDSKVVDQYLLLLTIAQHHPAFNFEQQTFLTELSLNLESYVREMENSRTKYELTTGLQQSNLSDKDTYCTAQNYRYNSSQQKTCDSLFEAQITSLKVKPPHKRMSVRIRVVWGSNKITDAFKNPHDLFVFHKELVRIFPCEAKSTNQEKCIPPIPVAIATWSKSQTLNDSIITCMTEYIQQLNSRLPGYVLENDFVRKFFMPSNSTRGSSSRNTKHVEQQYNKQSDLPPRSSRFRSLTIYNSQMSEKSPGHHGENRQTVLPNSRKYPETSSYSQASPAQSPLSSPYVSPENSATNSRAPSPWSSTSVDRGVIDAPTNKFVSKDPTVEHSGTRRNNKEKQRTVPVDEFQSFSISKDNGSKLSKASDNKSPPNGLIGFPKKVLLQKSASLNLPNSNDSSPLCSEYSSPPQSPSPADTCNQSSSLSSSNEENADKRSLSNQTSDLGKGEDPETTISDAATIKRDDDVLNMKSNVNRTSMSVIPLPIPYSTIVTQMPPLQNIKPAYLQIPCRTNSAPQHMNPGTFVYDHQFSRIPLASALTFIPGPARSHPDRVMSSVSVPLSTISPFPVVTSGCSTAPSASCSFTTHKSSNMTVVTNSGVTSNRHVQKNMNPVRDCDKSPLLQTSDTPFLTGYLLNSTPPLTAVSCPCYTTNSVRPSPAPSPSVMATGASSQPSAVPVSLSYLGMPYLFHHSLPFLQTQPPSNGFVPQPAMSQGQGFTYTLPNGMTTLTPELMYPDQQAAFSIPPPTTQGNPSQTASQGSLCYAAYSQNAPPPPKIPTCYNCGKVGHKGPECKEPSMEDISKSGKFYLNYIPVKAPDSHE